MKQAYLGKDIKVKGIQIKDLYTIQEANDKLSLNNKSAGDYGYFATSINILDGYVGILVETTTTAVAASRGIQITPIYGQYIVGNGTNKEIYVNYYCPTSLPSTPVANMTFKYLVFKNPN